MARIDLHDRAAALVVRHGLTWHTALHAATLMASHPGLVITSGRRTRARNLAVGGARNSWHLHGRAVDFVAPRAVLEQAARTARAQRVSPRCYGPEEVLHEYRGTRREHLHVAW